MPCSFKPLRVCIIKSGCMLALLIPLFVGALNSGYAQLPPSTGAPRVGQKAPAFILSGQDGKQVSLAELLKPAAGASKKSGGLILIFYRGYW